MTWAFEPVGVRRWGERIVMVLIVIYLTVGVLAAEKLAVWLRDLPPELGETLLDGVRLFHAYSPFTVLRDVLRDPPHKIVERFLILQGLGLVLLGFLTWRAASRLQGHFRDRHYMPVQDVSRQHRPAVGERPLAWWAVKRVSEYSGRVNLWLAGGFALLYAAYTVAGEGSAILHLRAEDTKHLEEALERIRDVPGVLRTQTQIVLPAKGGGRGLAVSTRSPGS